MAFDPSDLVDYGRNSAGRPKRFEDHSTEIEFTTVPTLQDGKDQGGWISHGRTGIGPNPKRITIGTRGQDRDVPDEKE